MIQNSLTQTITDIALRAESVSVYYGSTLAVKDVFLEIPRNQIVAFIGPSGCGKSTILRCFNRMNDLIPGAQVKGRITFNGQDIHDRRIDPVELRRRVGMVFQKPNPFRNRFMTISPLGLGLMGIREIWMNWLSVH